MLEEWESEGYDDIRSIARCGGIISPKSGSERPDDGESGEWSDMRGKKGKSWGRRAVYTSALG